MNLAEKLLTVCIQQGITVAAAESMTGGALSARVVAIPNASQYFLGAIVAYTNEIKKNVLNVSEKTLEKFGAVSKETAIEMLKGVQDIIQAKFSVAITGVAGPSGGSAQKPVGLVYVAFGFINEPAKIETLQLKGSRETVIISTVEKTLHLMLNTIHR